MPITPPTISTLVAIRAAHHPEATRTYDRVVFEFSGPVPLLRIEYVKELIGDGSGLPIPIAGRAILLVQLTPAHAHDDNGQSSAPARIKPKLPLVKEIACSGDFEAVVAYGIGLGRNANTRVLTMNNPHRLVIDFLV